MKIIISRKTNNKYFFDENKNDDLHTKEGLIKKEDILNCKNTQNIVKSNKGGREFLVLEGNDLDSSEKIIRGPQIITNKDLGYIIARTRVNKNSKILEAGGGSGAATIFFANLVEKVKTFEVVKEHFEIIEKNLKRNEILNVELIHGDLYENIEKEKENFYDLIFLDMPNPNKILETSLNSLKCGKYIVCYQPSISQIIEIVNFINENKRNELYIEEISEINVRNWKVTNKIARPNFRKEIDHTAFLVFIRKV
jgi:tRNA (adenine57-N1/adenine58-N1)-methyltransferase